MNKELISATSPNISFASFNVFSVSSSSSSLNKWFLIDAAYTSKRHWDGILQWFKSQITNEILEGLNSLIQAAKARARGYRTNKNLIAMIYLIGGKFNFGLPT